VIQSRLLYKRNAIRFVRITHAGTAELPVT
jgi:hypothetical protein